MMIGRVETILKYFFLLILNHRYWYKFTFNAPFITHLKQIPELMVNLTKKGQHGWNDKKVQDHKKGC